jgi:arylsulfatase
VPGQKTVDRYRSAKLIQGRSFTVRVDLDFATGDSGVLVSHGSLGGGYELTIDDNQFVWTHNAHGSERHLRGGPIRPGTQQLVAEVVAHPGGRWAITLRADHTAVAGGDGFPAFLGMAPLEGIDIARSRRSPVSWTRHCEHGSFAYRGALRSVTYTPGDLAPDAPESLVNQRNLRQTTFD